MHVKKTSGTGYWKKSLTLFRNNFATFYLNHNKNLAYLWTGGKEGKTFP